MAHSANLRNAITKLGPLEFSMKPGGTSGSNALVSLPVTALSDDEAHALGAALQERVGNELLRGVQLGDIGLQVVKDGDPASRNITLPNLHDTFLVDDGSVRSDIASARQDALNAGLQSLRGEIASGAQAETPQTLMSPEGGHTKGALYR